MKAVFISLVQETRHHQAVLSHWLTARGRQWAQQQAASTAGYFYFPTNTAGWRPWFQLLLHSGRHGHLTNNPNDNNTWKCTSHCTVSLGLITLYQNKSQRFPKGLSINIINIFIRIQRSNVALQGRGSATPTGSMEVLQEGLFINQNLVIWTSYQIIIIKEKHHWCSVNITVLYAVS